MTVNYITHELDSETFPKGFMNVGLQSFAHVFKTKQTFVDFTIYDMKRTTGFFLLWQNYCRSKRGLIK